MADRAITDLTAATTLNDSDALVLQQGTEAKQLKGQILANYCNMKLNARYAEITSDLAENYPKVSELSENVINISGKYPNYVLGTFELGDRYINSSGILTYYDSNTRVRTAKNTTISLKKGSIVGLTTYDEFRFRVQRYNDETGLWSYESAWMAEDYVISEDGQFALLLQKETAETISDITVYTSKLYLKKYGIIPSITNITSENDIFSEEIKQTIDSVRSKTTSRALVFGIITDTHYDGIRKMYFSQSMENMERLSREIGFDAIVHLGDVINGYEEKDVAKEQLQFCVKKLLNCGARNTFVLIGNHDNDNGAGNANRISDAELYGIMERHNESYVNRSAINTTNVPLYNAISDNAYVDYPTFKTRLIMFDSCYYGQGFSDETIAWVRTTMSSAPSDYHFVFMTHMSTEAKMNGGVALGNAKAFKELLAEYKDRIYCYIHGHSHCDYIGYDNEFAQIAICCAVPDQPPSTYPEGATVPSRTIGEVTQDCFDIVIILPDESKSECIRFGAGDDRTIPFRES